MPVNSEEIRRNQIRADLGIRPVKAYRPSAFFRVKALLDAGETHIPAKLVRGLIKEWDRESGWNEAMCRKLEAVLLRYGP